MCLQISYEAFLGVCFGNYQDLIWRIYKRLSQLKVSFWQKLLELYMKFFIYIDGVPIYNLEANSVPES